MKNIMPHCWCRGKDHGSAHQTEGIIKHSSSQDKTFVSFPWDMAGWCSAVMPKQCVSSDVRLAERS